MTEEQAKQLVEKKKEELAMTGAIRPDAKQCTTCMHRLEDTKYTRGAEKATCQMFPEIKPKEVLMDGKNCEYYEKEED